MTIIDTVFLTVQISIAHTLIFPDFAPYCEAMATRQLRISDPQQIKEQISRFVGKKINIVLRDGTAMLGVLKASNDQEVVLLNMAQKSQRYPIATIIEVYIDSLV